jgi:HEPN domain-containing protein
MNDATRAEVREWLAISLQDLEAARLLAKQGTTFAEIVLYHCQQCAEKAVKGFLIFHGQSFPRTHDVAVLVRLAGAIEAGFLSWEEIAEVLSDYATAYRYPGVDQTPDEEQVAEALEFAETIYRQAMTFLGDELGPSPSGSR